MDESNRARLCQTCKSMVARINEEYPDKRLNVEPGPHHKSFFDLATAAAQNCGICMRLHNSLMRDERCFRSYRQPQSQHQDLWLGYWFELNRQGDPHLWIDDAAVKQSDVQTGSLRPPAYFHKFIKFSRMTPNILQEMVMSDGSKTSYTGDAQVIAQARSWLHECDGQHASCFGTIDQSYQPPRLLQILGQGIKLVDIERTTERRRYITLSYCWGRNPQHVVLTAGNLGVFRRGVESSFLARTFRDCIRLSQALGFDYIWIDALCILQSGPGHVEDWQRHLSEMALIYLNCDLNVAVDHGDCAESGLFVQRNPEELKLCVLDLPSLPRGQTLASQSSRGVIDTSKQSYVINEPIPAVNTPSTHSLFLRFSQPLYQRGWVLQERLLSPRILHFGEQQISWECSAMARSESLPYGLSWDSLNLESSLAQPLQSMPFSLDLKVSRIWFTIVDSYCRTALTNRRDRLPALAGIAKRICDLRSTTYVAGMLREDMPDCLLWSPYRFSLPGLELPYRAPSWSWASYEGIVHHSGIDLSHHMLQIQKIQLGFVDEANPFGEIKSGVLTIKAPMYHSSFSASQKDDHNSLKLTSLKLTSCRSVEDSEVLDLGVNLYYDSITLNQKLPERTYLLFVGDNEKAILGLLIEPAEAESRDHWRRVGAFRSYKPWDKRGTETENIAHRWSRTLRQLRNCPKSLVKLV